MTRPLQALCAALLVAATYWLIVRPAEERLAGANAQAERFVAHALADEAAVANADRLVRLQREIAQELRGVSLRTDRPALVAGLLHDLEAIASRRGVRLLSVRDEPVAAPRERDDPFDVVALDVAMTGGYRDLLEAVAELSRSRVLTGVERASIVRASGPSSPSHPALEADLQMSVFHLRGDASI